MKARPDRASAGAPEPAFTRRSAFWISLTAVVSFITALLLMAFGGDPNQGSIAGPSLFSSSALGHGAFGRFLEESGFTVKARRNRRVLQGGPDTAHFLIEPENPEQIVSHGGKGDYLEDLAGGSGEAPLIVVLPKWKGESFETPAGLWMEKVSLLEKEVAEVLLVRMSSSHFEVKRTVTNSPRVLSCRTAWGDRLDAELIAPQVLERTGGLGPVVSTGDGVLIGRLENGPAGSRPVHVISDPDLLNNHGLARGDNAAIVLRYLEKNLEVRSVVFDEIIHGLERETPFLAETLRFPLNLIVLHGLLLFSLILWAAGTGFGKPIPLPPRLMAGRRGLIENTAQLLGLRGHVRESAARYFDQVLEDVARHYHQARDVPRDRLLAVVQRLSDHRGRKVDLAAIREGLQSPGRSRRSREVRSVESALALHRWRQEMIDVR